MLSPVEAWWVGASALQPTTTKKPRLAAELNSY
jgi:hypothetical protein